MSTSLVELLESPMSVYNLLRRLFNGFEEPGSIFMWETHAKSPGSPSSNMRRRYWSILLPYSIAWTLILPYTKSRGRVAPDRRVQREHDKLVHASSFTVPLNCVDERMSDYKITLTPYNPLQSVRSVEQQVAWGCGISGLFIPLSLLALDAGGMPEGWLIEYERNSKRRKQT